MIAAIKYDEITREHTYMYLNRLQNKFEYSGFKITDDGITLINKDFLIEIIDIFIMKKDSIYQGHQFGFDVYLDEKTGLKHYFKGGKENFSALFKFNGEDPIIRSELKDSIYGSYEDDLDENDIVLSEKEYRLWNKLEVFKFKILNAMYICTAEMILLLSVLGIVLEDAKVETENIVDSLTHVDFCTCCGTLNCGKYAQRIDSLAEMNYLIYNSDKLTSEDKAFFSNSILLDDVLLYTKGTAMDYLYNLKFEDLEIKRFKSSDSNSNVLGFYNLNDPNALNGLDSVDQDYWLAHEYIHLLQFPFLSYSYLQEATADIIAHEYLEFTYEGYPNKDKVVRKLMDVIGPKIVWEYVFTGDDSKLNTILSKNLTEIEYNLFVEILKDKDDSRHEQLSQLVDKLYYNLNQDDIKNNKNIYDLEGNFIDKRIYFNESIMPKNPYYMTSVKSALDSRYINDDTIIYYEVFFPNNNLSNKLSEYFLQGIPTKTKLVQLDGSIKSYEILEDKIKVLFIDGTEKLLTSEEALNLKLFVKRSYYYLDQKQFELVKNMVSGYDIITGANFKYKMPGAILKPIKYYYENIKMRFPDDTVRSQDSNQTLKFNF